MGIVVDGVAHVFNAGVNCVWQLFGQNISVDAGWYGDVLGPVDDFYGHLQARVTDRLVFDKWE